MNFIGVKKTKNMKIFVDKMRGGLIDGKEFADILISHYKHSVYKEKRIIPKKRKAMIKAFMPQNTIFLSEKLSTEEHDEFYEMRQNTRVRINLSKLAKTED